MNPMFAGYATKAGITMSPWRIMLGGKGALAATGHELTHMLQEVRWGALSGELTANLSARRIAFFEAQGMLGGLRTAGNWSTGAIRTSQRYGRYGYWAARLRGID
jgi:hypothetical protein